MAWKDSKRKKELVKALKTGQKVFYHALILNSGRHAPPVQVKKFWGNLIKLQCGVTLNFVEGDYFTVEK